MNRYAFTSAIYGNSEEVSLSSTIIGGPSKHKVKLIDSSTVKFSPTSLSQQKTAFDKHLEVLKEAQKLAEESGEFDIVFGGPLHGINFNRLLGGLRNQYVDLLNETLFIVEVDGSVDEIRTNTLGPEFNNLWGKLLANFSEESSPNMVVDIHSRGFVDNVVSYNEPTDPQQRESIENAAERFEALIKEYDSEQKLGPDSVLSKVLDEMVEKEVIQSSMNHTTRFYEFHPSLKKYREHVIANFFRIGELRSVYGSRLMHGLEISNNFALKCFTDPSSPPFADVGVTYLGDRFDKDTGEEPCVVMLQHD